MTAIETIVITDDRHTEFCKECLLCEFVSVDALVRLVIAQEHRHVDRIRK
jgi:hypothetical protein